MNKMLPKIFKNNIKKEIVNFLNKEKYQLVGGDDMVFTETDINKITKICNQKDTYELLFKNRLNGRPYTQKDAQDFIDWLKKGWKDQTHFVFFVRKNDGEIIGAIDIKSNDLSRAEIGYWGDENYRGFMTNTLEQLISLAKNAGFVRLFAGVRSDNLKSLGVLERANFKKTGEEKEVKGYPHLEYEKLLTAKN
jgi:RimJ/RimL family protein N-acetyltransferase